MISVSGLLLLSNEALADCPVVPFADTSDLGPLQPGSTLEELNIASLAGLRTLEFATNFQRRSTNLIGQNPLIVASSSDGSDPYGLYAGAPYGGGGSASADGFGGKVSALVSVFGATGDEDLDAGAGIDWDTQAAAVAVDYAVTSNIFIGAMIGASDFSGCSAPNDNFITEGSVNVTTNDVEGDFQVVSFYGVYESEGFYVDSIVSIGEGEFDFRRAQTVNGLNDDGFLLLDRVDEVIVANTDGDLFRASLAGGINRRFNQLQVSPFGRLSYAFLDIAGYSEELDLNQSPNHPAPESGGGFALRLADQEVESLTSGLGVGVSYVLSTSKAVFSFKTDFEWVHEFNDDANSLRNALAGFSQGTIANVALAQTFPERELDSDYFFLGFGTTAVIPNGFQFFGKLQTLLGFENVTETHLGLGLRYEF